MRKLRAIWDILWAREWVTFSKKPYGYFLMVGKHNSLDYWTDFSSCLTRHVEDTLEQESAIKQANKIING